MLREANLTVWMHGVLEISAIIIGTAAGITLGKGLVFPGTYNRLQAFQISARRGIKIMIGVIVMLVFAALVEGNLTRVTQAGDLFRGVFIAFCLAVVMFYYVWYPYYVVRSLKSKVSEQPLGTRLTPDAAYNLSFSTIKSSGEIFGDAFYFIKINIGYYLSCVSTLTVAFCGYAFIASRESPDTVFKLASLNVGEAILRLFLAILSQFKILDQFFENPHIPYLPAANTLLYTLLAYLIFTKIIQTEKRHQSSAISFQPLAFSYQASAIIHQPSAISFQPSAISLTRKVMAFLGMIVAAGLMFGLGSLHPFFLFMVFAVILPVVALWMFLMLHDGFSPLTGFQHTLWLAQSSWSLTFGAYYVLFLIGYLAFAFTNSVFMETYLTMVGWNTHLTQAALDSFVVIIMAGIAVFAIFSIFAILFTGMAFLYYSLIEINEANALVTRIREIGVGKKIQGMMRE